MMVQRLEIDIFAARGTKCHEAVQEVQLEAQSWYAKASAVVEDRGWAKLGLGNSRTEEMKGWAKFLPVLQECLFAMRTVVAFGGEHKELQRFKVALIQARRGGVPRYSAGSFLFKTGLSFVSYKLIQII